MDISRAVAENLYKVANYGLIACGVLNFWMGRVRDRYASADVQVATDKAAQANKEAGKAFENAGIANREAASLRERAAVYEKDAAEARKETGRLKSQLSWRELTDSEMQKMIEILKEKPEKVLITHRDDPESAAFAWDLNVTFMRAGWTTSYQEEPVKGLKYGVLTWQNPELPGGQEFQRAISSLSSLHQVNLDMGLKIYLVDVGFRPRRNMEE